MRSIGPKIWVEEQPMILPLMGDIGRRMTVIQLANKELMIISPVPMTENLSKELMELGQIRYLIGPNSTHHLSLRPYHQQFPDALLAAPEKLQKRKKMSFQITIREGQVMPWSAEVQNLIVDSPGMMSEAVFLHSLSRTLIVTDLLFNIYKADSKLKEWALRLNKAYGQLGMSRMGQFAWKDRDELRKKIEMILNWDFEQIVLAHGEIVVKNGRQKFRESFNCLLS